MPALVTSRGAFEVDRPVYAIIHGLPTDVNKRWNCTNVLELLKPPPKRNRGGLTVPRSHGRLARRLWDDSVTRLLVFDVWGERDDPDAPLPALEENLAYMASIWGASVGGDSTVDCELVLSSGVTWSGPVQLEDFDWDDGAQMPVKTLATLSLFMPAGSLTKDVP